MTLGRRDLEVVQRATLDLHEERDLDAFREASLRIFLEAVPAEMLAWVEFGFGPMATSMRKIVHWESPARTTPVLLKRLISMVDQHPFTLHGKKTGNWGPLRLSDFWSTRQLLASPLYREVYRHLGVGRLMACAAFRGNRTGTMNIGRPLADRDFSERDRTVFGLLMPHFTQALRAAEQFTIRRQAGSQPLPSLGLTKREIEVAMWLERGRTNSEIAALLGMNARTVEKHVERILEKLGVENRTAAARLITGSASFGARSGPEPAKRRARG